MIVYLDTNAVVFLAQRGLARFSAKTKKLIGQSDLLLSPTVLLELEYLQEIGRSALRARDVLGKLEHEIGLRLCDLPFATITSVALDEKWTHDPFDRLIVANAKANGFAPLLSSDEAIRKHYPRTVW